MTDNSLAIRTFDETERIASAMVKSGYFTDTRDASQAIVKILAGREMGFEAFASMTGVYIIQGRPSVGANLMAAAVKRHPRYDYRVQEMTDEACEIIFYQDSKELGRSRFTLADARKAGTKNLDKFPRNMLFARAMSNGVRWYTPDVFSGAPVYTPEELGATVNETGEVIDYTPPTVVVYDDKPTPPQAPAPAAPAMTVEEAEAEFSPSQNMAYGAIETEQLTYMLNRMLKAKQPTDDQVRKIEAVKVILAARANGRQVIVPDAPEAQGELL